MKLKSKQRAFLKKEAHSLEAIVRIGKEGITDNVIKSILDVIASRELIKIKLLQNTNLNKNIVAYEIAEKIDGIVVDVIGKTIILFKENKEKPKISEVLKKYK